LHKGIGFGKNRKNRYQRIMDIKRRTIASLADEMLEGSMIKRSASAIPFAGSRLDESRHVCAFFNSDEEEYGVLLPFIKEGFECDDKAIHVVNPGQRQEHLRRLTEAGIDHGSAEERGQLEVRTNTDEYLRDGRFDQDRMLDAFEHMASGNAKGPFPRSRIVCRMDWAGDGTSHIEDVIEFESRVNDVWVRHNDAVICTYHLQKFGGETVIDIMRTHPMIIIGGVLQHNPFYVPPNAFLQELRERRDLRKTSISTAT
jgi:DcmR-like sensory protein